jgi:hypothetical protein
MTFKFVRLTELEREKAWMDAIAKINNKGRNLKAAVKLSLRIISN